ncbi:hypothetical protein JCM16775_1752 [Leptotrichia hofstadii]|uniref:Uncharacterized protein n=2 Tax=Leptotrichia hofstadii TaxID=157688 RepID=A0A510JKZ2_9FUSO|nr:hypothetical protein [Leptotrichia hofstadii]BBM39041.1 hypothetical protein JCM16775_1752 [Leptotrichia hofstadii]
MFKKLKKKMVVDGVEVEMEFYHAFFKGNRLDKLSIPFSDLGKTFKNHPNSANSKLKKLLKNTTDKNSIYYKLKERISFPTKSNFKLDGVMYTWNHNALRDCLEPVVETVHKTGHMGGNSLGKIYNKIFGR